MPTNIPFNINSIPEGLRDDDRYYIDPFHQTRVFINNIFFILLVAVFLFCIKYIIDIVRFRKDKEKRKKAAKRLLQMIVIEFFILAIWTIVWWMFDRALKGEI